MSTFERLTLHPLIPTLILATKLWRISQRGFDSITLFGGIGFVIVLLWFIGAWYNTFSKGRLFHFFNSSDQEDDDELPKIPASFSEFEKSRIPLSPIQRAISDALVDGDDLMNAIREKKIESVAYERDAVSICAALSDCEANSALPFKNIIRLVDLPGSAQVHKIFSLKALPIMHRIYLRERRNTDPKMIDTLFSIMRSLVAYGYVPAFRDIVEASRDPLFYSSYSWVSVFRNIDDEDPDSKTLIQLLAKPLPKDFARIAFLDQLNQWCIESKMKNHPFDSEEGIAALDELLTITDPENTSYGISATCAIPFLTSTKRDSLLERARSHTDPPIRMEAAWAAARLKIPWGVSELKETTLDWKTGSTAMRYMKELGLSDEIPAAALDSKHFALSKMAEWLEHPNELARLPDSLTISDQRELQWPATGKRELQTLLHWKLGEEEGISFTGSCTWALFSSAEPSMPILDLYAMYNSWEMKSNGVPEAPESFSDLVQGRKLLIDANPDMKW